MAELTEAERSFYEWFHFNSIGGDYLPRARDTFLAGWEAATKFIGSALDSEPVPEEATS